MVLTTNKQLVQDAFDRGVVLWLPGYAPGFLFFLFVPNTLIGWAIMSFGVPMTLFVLFKKVNATSLRYFFFLSIVWIFLAVALDYLFVVQILHPADGYYKLDVYLYYVLMLVIPVAVGLCRKR